MIPGKVRKQQSKAIGPGLPFAGKPGPIFMVFSQFFFLLFLRLASSSS